MLKSFLMIAADERLKSNKLLKINDLIDWSQIRLLLKKIDRSGLGPHGYDVLKLLKALLLQAWYSLSDVDLEESLRVRLDFLKFTGLDEDVPDATTLCRFRNLLISRGRLEKILSNINKQLESKGLKIKESAGAILDATIIESAGRPKKTLETIPVDRNEEENSVTYETSDVQLSADKDARWLKKGNKSYFGYKAFVVTDSEKGFINKVSVTPANVSESRNFEKAIENIKAQRLYADKGYASAENRNTLKRMKIKSGIMFKANKNNPLKRSQKVFNKLVSKVRYKIEQCFGTLKRRFNFQKASYFGTNKVMGQTILKAIVFNLLKGANIT